MSETKLLFDVGNSRIKWAYSAQGEFVTTGSLPARDISPSILKRKFGEQSPPNSIWISNVGSSEVLDQLNQWFNSEMDLTPTIVKVSKHSCGIDNHYQSQDTLGVDRWLAAIGARSVVDQGHVIIVDAGTAVTIDWLSDSNQYEGGAIVPGVELMHDALTSRTAGVKSKFSWTQQILGGSTVECVNSGISFALVGAIERIVSQLTKQIAAPVSMILTGGNAEPVSQRSDLAFIIENELVLLGVANVSSEKI